MTNAEDRRAPVQEERGAGTLRRCDVPKGTISWAEHEAAWAAYARTGFGGKSAEQIAARGGFGLFELCLLLGRPPTTWRLK